MKAFFLLILSLTGLVCRLNAQTFLMNWSTSISGGWINTATSGTANNIGGSGVNLSVSMTKTGGVFTTTLGPSGGPATPTVANSTYIVAGSSANLQISLDYATNTDYTDINFAFNKTVYNVNFNIADIDRLTPDTYYYLDELVITGKNGGLTVNPVLSKYDAVTDPNFYFISGNTAWVNPANPAAGNSASDATDQKGTVKVNFLSGIKQFTIRYQNHTGTIADPNVQNISIGNIGFQTSIPVPLKLLSFESVKSNENSSELTWTTAGEIDFDHFSIERSRNGVDFTSIGSVKGKGGNFESLYHFSVNTHGAPDYFYRLKMVDLDGSYSYSKTITISGDGFTGISVYPTCFNSQLQLVMQAPRSQQLSAELVNMVGRTVFQTQLVTSAGMNQFTITLPSHLSRGAYLLLVDGKKAGSILTKR
jgi:hypothetical protein